MMLGRDEQRGPRWVVAERGLVQKWAVERPRERAQRRHSNFHVGGARKAATDWSGKPGILSAVVA